MHAETKPVYTIIAKSRDVMMVTSESPGTHAITVLHPSQIHLLGDAEFVEWDKKEAAMRLGNKAGEG